MYNKEVGVRSKIKKERKTTCTGRVSFITRHSVGWISQTQLLLALAQFVSFFKLFLFISLLCSAASITLRYQNTSTEVSLPFQKSQWVAL